MVFAILFYDVHKFLLSLQEVRTYFLHILAKSLWELPATEQMGNFHKNLELLILTVLCLGRHI